MEKQSSPMEGVGMNRLFWKNKKVLITGHTGFKGSWLSLWLNDMGAEIYGYALEPNTKPALFNLLGLESKINSHIGDVRNLDGLKNYMQKVSPEIIIHLAAQALVRYSYKNPIETYSTNVMGTVNLLESVRCCDSVKTVVIITSDKCYDNREWGWGYRENEAMGGFDPYSSSKGCAELVTAAYRNCFFNPKSYAQHGKAVATARAGNVIGGGDWAQDRLIPDIILAFLRKEVVNIRNPKAIRPWQHVLEPLSGYLTLAEKLSEEPKYFAEAWNFGPFFHSVKSVEQIINYIASHWRNEVKWNIDKSPQPHEATFLSLDISKALNKLHWSPRYSLEQTLDSLIKWYQTWHNLGDIIQLTLDEIHTYESMLNNSRN